MIGYHFKIHVIATSFVASAVALASAEVYAGSLDEEIGDMTKKLALYLKSKGETQIAIGQFVGPPQLAASSGPGIVQSFQDHFGRLEIRVATRANIGLKGEYTLAKVPSTDEGIGVRIQGSLVDSFGEVLTDFSFQASEKSTPGKIEKIVDKHEDVVRILGATTDLHPEDADADRNRDLKDRIINPSLHLDGTRCAASATSPYQIEICIDGNPLPVDVRDGLGFVDIQRNQIYSIRMHNQSEYDAAVRLSIDGLSIFRFSELRNPDGQPRYQFYVIPKGQSIELKGWHKTNEKVSSFRVTSYAESAAASIQHEQNIGTITATFSAAWPKDGPRPQDEDTIAKGSGNATGFGPVVTQLAKEVERQEGKLRASISLRYTR